MPTKNYPANRKPRKRGSYITHHNIIIEQKDPSIPRSEDKDYQRKYRKEWGKIQRKEKKENRHLIRLGEDKMTVKRGKILISFD